MLPRVPSPYEYMYRLNTLGETRIAIFVFLPTIFVFFPTIFVYLSAISLAIGLEVLQNLAGHVCSTWVRFRASTNKTEPR